MGDTSFIETLTRVYECKRMKLSWSDRGGPSGGKGPAQSHDSLGICFDFAVAYCLLLPFSSSLTKFYSIIHRAHR
jgi:hypothetical protein